MKQEVDPMLPCPDDKKGRKIWFEWWKARPIVSIQAFTKAARRSSFMPHEKETHTRYYFSVVDSVLRRLSKKGIKCKHAYAWSDGSMYIYIDPQNQELHHFLTEANAHLQGTPYKLSLSG